MPNMFANWISDTVDGFARRVASYINDPKAKRDNILAMYYDGDHRPQLKVTQGRQDDNITLNFVGLAIDRSVSRLFRGGVKFVTPDGADEQREYLDTVWDLNKKEIILYQVGLHGSIYGTPYFKIRPDAIVDPYTGKPFPRLVALDPEIVRIRTDPQDMNEVVLYQISYKIGEKWFAEITVRADYDYQWNQNNEALPAPRNEITNEQAAWRVEEWEQSSTYANQRTMTSSAPWPYDFPPIIHWKNLPSLKSCYGDSDIDDAINVQDKENFTVSNTGKIIKYHAHPQTVGTGFSIKQLESLDSAVGTFHAIPAPEAKVANLEMQSDLASSNAFALSLRQAIFDISREVDISSMADKLGSLTNFGLRVLWSDAIDKNDTKRSLYGDALIELNRRLLVLAGWTMEASDPGVVQWGDALPVNVLEEMQADQLALEMGIIDKETVAMRYRSRYGKEWEDIEAALEEEQSKANQGNSDIGAMILRNFNNGMGAEQGQPPMSGQQRREMMRGQEEEEAPVNG